MKVEYNKNGNIIVTDEMIKIASKNGISKDLLYQRLYCGMEIEKALTKPKRNPKKYEPYLEEIRRNNIKINTIYSRVKRGWTIEKAINEPIKKSGRPRNSVELAF